MTSLTSFGWLRLQRRSARPMRHRRDSARHLARHLAWVAVFTFGAISLAAAQQPAQQQGQQQAQQPEQNSSAQASAAQAPAAQGSAAPAPTGQAPTGQAPADAADTATPAVPQTPKQKQLADDTAKLLSLANELKAELDKSTKDTLSLSVIKKAEAVEKLAHKVRDEMKTQ